MDMMVDILAIAAIGGLLGLDRTAAGQFMVSQPIVAGPVAGWVLGDVTTGLLIGVILELIWVMDLPIGTFVPADPTIAAVSATAIAVIGSRGESSLAAAGISLLLTVAIAPLTMAAETGLRKWNSRLGAAVAGSSGTAAGAALSRGHLTGAAAFYVKSFLLLLLVIPAGIGALNLFMRLPGEFQVAMALYVKLLPLIGVASIARKLSYRLFDRFLMSGFFVASLLGIAFDVSPVIIAICAVVAGWLGVRYRE